MAISPSGAALVNRRNLGAARKKAIVITSPIRDGPARGPSARRPHPPTPLASPPAESALLLVGEFHPMYSGRIGQNMLWHRCVTTLPQRVRNGVLLEKDSSTGALIYRLVGIGPATSSGSILALRQRSDQWRCGPVTRPVRPE